MRHRRNTGWQVAASSRIRRGLRPTRLSLRAPVFCNLALGCGYDVFRTEPEFLLELLQRR